MGYTRFKDNRLYLGAATFRGPVTFEVAVTSTAAGGDGSLEIPFVLADLTAGTKAVATLPANVIILGVRVEVTTALVFGGTTTGVTATVGNADADGFAAATAIAGATGVKRPAAAGALVGTCVAGSTGGCTITFTPTGGGGPTLADVSAGAGKVTVYYKRTEAAS